MKYLIKKEKTMFKRSIYFIFLILLVVPNISFASEPIVIIADGEYVMGTGESMEVSEAKALKKAEQKAAEQAGVYVKSYTKVKNLTLESDVVEVIANHTMKIEVLEKKKTGIGDLDAIKFYVKIKATMSQEDIDANLKKVMQDQSIVVEYNRLKADFEKQNMEMEKLKKQLELATGGDKQKIAKIISEEEKKYKATLWIERAQQLWEPVEKLKAYEKALELNPDLPQAYFGIAKALEEKSWEKPTTDEEKEKKLESLRKATENLNRAIALDENYAEAYALRAEILHKIKWLEHLEENERDYNEKILKDINRALALNAPNKKELFYLRASVYLEQLQDNELKQVRENKFDYKVIENYLNKALNEIEQAGSLCKDGDLECLAKYYNQKGNAYNFLIGYYARQNDWTKVKEFESLRENFLQKATEIQLKMEEKVKEETKEDVAFYQTEYGKIEYYLDTGWKEKVMGVSFKEIEQKTDGDKEKIGKQIISKIKQKISSGTASAEDYLFLSYSLTPEINERMKEAYFKKGIELMEKRNPQGIDALLLVSIYILKGGNDNVKLNYLDRAKAIVEKNLPQAQKILSLDDFSSLISEMLKAKSDIEGLNVIKKLGKLNKQQAEAFHWFFNAVTISQAKAEIYEKLDLLSKAREEYLYLCNTFKIDEACKNVERLKK